MSFWDKALSAPVQRRAAPVPVQHPGYQPQQPSPHQGLAVGHYQHGVDEAGRTAAEQGYITKPPKWVQKQPTDHCPECDGVNFALHGDGEGTYGQELVSKNEKGGRYLFGHCFDCGYRLNGRTLSDAQVGNAHAHGLGTGAVQATRQPHSLGQNFFEIRISR